MVAHPACVGCELCEYNVYIDMARLALMTCCGILLSCFRHFKPRPPRTVHLTSSPGISRACPTPRHDTSFGTYSRTCVVPLV